MDTAEDNHTTESEDSDDYVTVEEEKEKEAENESESDSGTIDSSINDNGVKPREDGAENEAEEGGGGTAVAVIFILLFVAIAGFVGYKRYKAGIMARLNNGMGNEMGGKTNQAYAAM